MSGSLLRLAARLVFCNRIISGHLVSNKSTLFSNARCFASIEGAQKITIKPKSSGLRKTNDLERIRKFISQQRLKGVLYSNEENANIVDGFWPKIIEAGDIILVEKYLNMRAKLGLSMDIEKILSDLKDVGLKPSIRVYASFILQSCGIGDMNQTSYYLRILRDAGIRPGPFIFSQVLHGYIKAGLPEEASSTQELLSQIGLWPSRQAYEGLLTAYADIGDKESLLRTLDEAYAVLPSIKDREGKSLDQEIPTTFLLDLYTRIVCSSSDANSLCNEILTKISVNDSLPLNFCVDTIKVLLAKGRPAAALEIFKMIPSYRPEVLLDSLPLYAIAGGLDAGALEPFWNAANLDSRQLLILRNKAKLYFFRNSKPFNELADRFQACLKDNNVEGAINTLKKLNKSNSSLVISFIVPKLIRIGYPLMDLVNQIQNPEISQALAFGYVLDNLSSLEANSDLKASLDNCLKLVNECRANKLLPYNSTIRLGRFYVEKLMFSVLSVSDKSEIKNVTKSTAMHDVFGIFNHSLSKHGLNSFYVQIFEALLISKIHAFHNIPTNTVIQLVADVCVHQNVTFNRSDWFLPAIKDVGVSEDVIQQLSSDHSAIESPFSDINALLFGSQSIHMKSNSREEPSGSQMDIPSTQKISTTAESLVASQKTDPRDLENKLQLISNSWVRHKKLILLFNLVNLGADDLVERVLQSIPDTHRVAYEPLKYFAQIIKSCLEPGDAKVKASENVKQIIQNLQSLSSNELFITMRGPHMDTLFRCWPADQIPELINITKKLSKFGLNSVSLQLAGVLINRGLSDKVSTLLENNETVPFTFMVGTPRNALTESAFLSTMEYVKAVDPNHIYNFVDHCLRNAALTSNDNDILQLVHIVVSPPYGMDLLQVCIQPTLQIVYRRLKECKNLPKDILEAIVPISEKLNASAEEIST
ncbi:hypothetical protein MN116_002599 [Schistosoma mekongi]|uniref:Leucine-rich PPR motif-containing protein, mitochondrial n=1 Tax=Schistosoma mekongi TaxID=38744 RepID=A0AAE1ZFY5_SCHME|nr:hypothetical protein MN116_002599 [Schistosoma mekongi]